MSASAPSLLAPRVLVPFLVATIVWGSTWLVIADQLGVVPPSWSIAYRFAFGAATMFIWAVLTKSPFAIGWAGQAFALLFGFAQFVLNFNFVYRAEAYVTSGLVAVVFALLLVPNAILARVFLNAPLSTRFLAGSGVALLGVAMLIAQELRSDAASIGETALGFAFTLLGVLSASVANVMQGSERSRTMPMAATLAWAMLWGTAINALYAWTTTGAPVFETRASYWLGTVYLGVFASAIAFSCYFAVIRAVGPARAAYSSVLTPIIAMLLSTLFEDYRWTVLAAAGGGVALIGLLIAFSAPRPATKSG